MTEKINGKSPTLRMVDEMYPVVYQCGGPENYLKLLKEMGYVSRPCAFNGILDNGTND